MTTNLITHLNQLTPTRLTNLLHQKQILHQASVTKITCLKSKQTNVSTVYHLQISYSQEEMTAPKKLFLKIPAPSFGQGGWGNYDYRASIIR